MYYFIIKVVFLFKSLSDSSGEQSTIFSTDIMVIIIIYKQNVICRQLFEVVVGCQPMKTIDNFFRDIGCYRLKK